MTIVVDCCAAASLVRKKMKPECAISSGYNPKSEETDDEGGLCRNYTNASKSNVQPINIKEEYNKMKVKEEDDISTDDEQHSPEHVLSSSSTYNPVKGEETDDEELGDKRTNKSSSHEKLINSDSIKAEVKDYDDISTDDERSPEYDISSGYDPIKSEETDEELDDKDTDKSNSPINIEEVDDVSAGAASTQESNIQRTKKKKKRKLPNNTSERKRRSNGRGGYVYLCNHEGCTSKVINGGVCIKHGAKVKICEHDGCTTQAIQGGVCIKHGAVKKVKKTCKHEGCTNQSKVGGFCTRHGATREKKTCSHEGCSNIAQNRGLCDRHGKRKNR